MLRQVRQHLIGGASANPNQCSDWIGAALVGGLHEGHIELLGPAALLLLLD